MLFSLSYMNTISYCLYVFCGFDCVLCADPYLNKDAGTMSPFEHGEVFVLDDGGEVSKFTSWMYMIVLISSSYGMNRLDVFLEGGFGPWKLWAVSRC